MSTRQSRKLIDPCRFKEGAGEYSPALSIFVNNVQVFGKATEETPPNFIVRTMAERGGSIYSRTLNAWFAYIPNGRNDYAGYPKYVSLLGDNGRVIKRVKADGEEYCLFPANACFYPPLEEIARRVDTLKRLSIAVSQNIDALKQANAIYYRDPDLKSQIERAERERLEGRATVSIPLTKNTGEGDIYTEKFSPDAQSYLQDYLALWIDTREELDALTGRATLGEKSERRITEEISVIQSAASTSIDVLIDNINMHAKYYGVDIKAARGNEIRINTPKPAQDAQNEGIEAQNKEGNTNE